MEVKKLLILGVVLIVLAVLFAVWFFFPRHATAPNIVPTKPPIAENNNSTTTIPESVPKKAQTNSETQVLPTIAEGDKIVSWDFKGAYADRPDLIAKMESEIIRFSDLIGKGVYPDLNLYVSIANSYDALGKGKQEYDYLVRAIFADQKSGLPWHNLSVLMERLGALETARIARERAEFLQPIFKPQP